MAILEDLQQRQTIFGTPVHFLTHEEIWRDFEPTPPGGGVPELADAVLRFGQFLESEFTGLDFVMLPYILAANYRSLSGDGPVCVPLLSEEQIANGDNKPLAAVIGLGGQHNIGGQFLANFTKAPSDTHTGFTANNEQWKLMQVCHEIGHLSGLDELAADVTGMITYYALTRDASFLEEWRNARTLKSLYNPDDPVDMQAVLASIILRKKFREDPPDHLNLDDQSIPELCAETLLQVNLHGASPMVSPFPSVRFQVLLARYLVLPDILYICVLRAH